MEVNGFRLCNFDWSFLSDGMMVVCVFVWLCVCLKGDLSRTWGCAGVRFLKFLVVPELWLCSIARCC